MKIRLTGARAECDVVVEALAGVPELLVVAEVSRPYPNRGDSRQVRVYVEAEVRERSVR